MSVGLVLGDLDLIDTDEAYSIETLAEGTDFGNPQPIEVAIRHLLQDGSIVEHERDDNREVALRVVIGGADGVSLADGEAALMAELYKRNTLTYTPPDGFGAPTVFDVLTSSLAHIMDDLAEVLLSERQFSIRLVCEPFGRSADEVVTAALVAPGSPTSVVIDDGSSTTGWAASHTLSTSGGLVRSTSGALGGDVTSSLTRTIAAVNMSTTPYLLVDWLSSGGQGRVSFRAYADGVQLTLVASGPVTGGLTRSIFHCPDTSVTVFAYQNDTIGMPGVATVRVLGIDQHVRTDDPRLTTGTTARQGVRSLAVSGSTRTQGTLVVEHETSALGDAQVYTFRDDGRGYSPRLRQFITSSDSPTADAALVSGAWNSLNTQMVFDITAASLYAGPHLLRARLQNFGGAAANETVTCTARVRINSTDVGPVVTWNTTLAVLAAGAGYVDYDLGRVVLPTADLAAATSALVRITIVDANPGSGLLLRFDEGWVYNLEVGALTAVACGTGSPASGGPSKRLYILPATVDKPRPSVLRGHASDRSDAFYPGTDVKSWMGHEFVPPAMAVFVVTSNALDPAVSLRHYPRWHSHAVRRF